MYFQFDVQCIFISLFKNVTSFIKHHKFYKNFTSLQNININTLRIYQNKNKKTIDNLRTYSRHEDDEGSSGEKRYGGRCGGEARRTCQHGTASHEEHCTGCS